MGLIIFVTLSLFLVFAYRVRKLALKRGLGRGLGREV
jgi:hypothetical protein